VHKQTTARAGLATRAETVGRAFPYLGRGRCRRSIKNLLLLQTARVLSSWRSRTSVSPVGGGGWAASP
jgi:hypothetical protein